MQDNIIKCLRTQAHGSETTHPSGRNLTLRSRMCSACTNVCMEFLAPKGKVANFNNTNHDKLPYKHNYA